MLKNIIFAVLAILISPHVLAGGKASEIMVYKNPYCGCCTNWVAHLKENGFEVREEKVTNIQSYKEKYGITNKLSSCHTAVVEGYVLEGHIPASDIRRLLKEKPDIRGLAVPGMTVGSPGMEQGNRKDSFNVIAIRKDGSIFVYNSYKGN